MAASSCAKEDSTAFTSIDKPGNPPPCRVIEKFPREQFEAFAALLEFRRRSETFRHVCRAQVAYYTFRNASIKATRTHRQNQEAALSHDRVAEVAEFVESRRTASIVATNQSLRGTRQLHKSTRGDDADIDSDLEAAAIRSPDPGTLITLQFVKAG